MERIQRKSVVVVLATLIGTFLAGVNGDSHGAPLSSCENMGRVHVAFPSQPEMTCPFEATVDKVYEDI